MRYLVDMDTPLNVRKCASATTTIIPSAVVCLDHDNVVCPLCRLDAKDAVPYPSPRLDPNGWASMKENHVLWCEALPSGEHTGGSDWWHCSIRGAVLIEYCH